MGSGVKAAAPLAARADTLFILSLSLLLVALNALKPLTTDDAIYLEFAQHLARHPLAPYGGTSIAVGKEASQFLILAPLVLPYWLALGIALFGDGELALKLWLFPIALVLVWAILRLARRFALGCELPATLVAAFSPTVLAGLNLMLDVPALALGLAAIELFFVAMDRGAIAGAAAAGLLAGLAMQTKYSAVTVPAAMLLASALRGRIGFGIVASVAAAAFFLAWEGFILAMHGQSQFLDQMLARLPATSQSRSMHHLYILFGEIAPALILLGLAALGASLRVVLAAAAVLLAMIAFSAFGLRAFALPGAAGAALWLLTGLAAYRLVRAREGDAGVLERGDTWFLIGWLLIELLAGYLLSPYPAARRLIGILFVVTLILFRLAAEAVARARPARDGMRVAVAFAVVFGLAVQALEIVTYSDQRAAAAEAARWSKVNAPGARAWFWGAGTFNHYARLAGIGFADPGKTALRPGDIVFDPLAPYFAPPLAGTDTFVTLATIPVGAALGIASALQSGHQLFVRRGAVLLRVHRVLKDTQVSERN